MTKLLKFSIIATFGLIVFFVISIKPTKAEAYSPYGSVDIKFVDCTAGINCPAMTSITGVGIDNESGKSGIYWNTSSGVCLDCGQGWNNGNKIDITTLNGKTNSSGMVNWFVGGTDVGMDGGSEGFACGDSSDCVGDKGVCPKYNIKLPAPPSGKHWQEDPNKTGKYYFSLKNDGNSLIFHLQNDNMVTPTTSGVHFIKLHRSPDFPSTLNSSADYSGSVDWSFKVNYFYRYWYSESFQDDPYSCGSDGDGDGVGDSTCYKTYYRTVDASTTTTDTITVNNVIDRDETIKNPLNFTTTANIYEAEITSISEVTKSDWNNNEGPYISRTGGSGSWNDSSSFSGSGNFPTVTRDKPNTASCHKSGITKSPTSISNGTGCITPTIITNEGIVEVNGVDYFYFANIAEPTISVTKEVCYAGDDIICDESFSPDTTIAKPGQNVRFRVTISNNGLDRMIIKEKLLGEKDGVKDKLPQAMSHDPSVVVCDPRYNCEIEGDYLKFDLDDYVIMPGDSIEIQYGTKMLTMWDGSKVKNDVIVNCKQRDNSNCSGTNSDSAEVSGQAGTAKKPPIWREIAP